MNGRFERYLQEQLGTTGFVILDHALAYQLRPDIFGTAGNCANAFSESQQEIDPYLRHAGVGLYAARLDLAADRFFIAARSLDQLAERIRWLVGRRAVEIVPVASVKQPVATVQRVQQGGPEIPSWPCTARTEALASAGLREEMFREQKSGRRRDRSL
jgi:hypothetical protein